MHPCHCSFCRTSRVWALAFIAQIATVLAIALRR
jgi:hypothetical protein